MENRKREDREGRVKKSIKGAGSVEYALLLGGLVLAFVAGVVVFGDAVRSLFEFANTFMPAR
jgi:Flp pilus assembly pilin Flp